MRVKRLLAMLGTVIAAGATSVVLSAAPAQAAIPTCTSWTTYPAPFETGYVVHVPTVGYQTGATYCELKRGNRNDAVTVLQRGLRYCHGYQIGVDGQFGSQTEGAVLALQRNANGAFGAGLEEDGQWGPATSNWTQFPVWTWPANVRTNRCRFSPA